jgi:cell cycle arrest protein BUB2
VNTSLLIYLHTSDELLHEDREMTQELGFTYVQGMNVLAAPFLFSMPSEMEAFFCFSKFIEECCPLYVQPTLEGVHRGLKVMSSPQQNYN